MGLEVKIAYTVLVFFEVYLELKENIKHYIKAVKALLIATTSQANYNSTKTLETCRKESKITVEESRLIIKRPRMIGQQVIISG